MKKHLGVALFLIFLAANATALSADLTAINRTATSNAPAVFEVSVTNDMPEPKTFRISSITSPAPDWFSYDYSTEVAAGEKGSLKIEIVPPEDAIQFNYGFTVYIDVPSEDFSTKLDDYFSVNSPYNLRILSTNLAKDTYKPGQTINASITIVNTAPNTVQDYKITAGFLNKTKNIATSSLAKGERKTYDINMKVPENSMPGTSKLEISLNEPGSGPRTVEYEISIEKVKNIVLDQQVSDRVLTERVTLTAVNEGNAEDYAVVSKQVPSYLDPLTSFSMNPSSVKTEGTQKTYSWNLTLAPGEKESVEVRTQYWPPLVLLGLLVIGLSVLKRLYTGVSFSKEAKRTDNGIKVQLVLENRSGTAMEDLKVEDFISDVASVKDEFPMAKPVMSKTANGTRLVWEIERMEPGEQRVFEYTIKPLVEVEEGIVLEGAELYAEDSRVKKTGEVEAEFRP